MATMDVVKALYGVTVLLGVFAHLGLCRTFKIAWLAPGPESGREVNSHTSVNALKLALSSVSVNPNILNGHKVDVKFFNVDCTSQGTMSVLLAAHKTYSPDVIIGPPCAQGLRIVAQLASFWNVPVFTWYNTGINFQDRRAYPTLIKMTPSLGMMGRSLRHVFQKNNWSKFVFLYDGAAPWTFYKNAVNNAIGQTNIRMVSSYQVNASMSGVVLSDLYNKIQKEAWVVVFAVPGNTMRRHMLAAGQAGMANGNYVFIQLDHKIHTEKQIRSVVLSNGRWKYGDKNDPAARQAYQSLLHIVTDPMNDDDTSPPVPVPRNRFDEFARLAATEGKTIKPGWVLPAGGEVDAYSLYLYDSVLVWAVLVDKIIAAGGDPKNGKQMAHQATSFMADGASGYISINDQLGRDGKTFVLSMDPYGNFVPLERLKFNGTYGYSNMRLRPMDEIIRRHGGQGGVRIMHTTTSEFGTTVPTMKGRIPRPPSDAVSILLAKVQALEAKILEHELHSHQHIPDHPHTPGPTVIPFHTHTQAPKTVPTPVVVRQASVPAIQTIGQWLTPAVSVGQSNKVTIRKHAPAAPVVLAQAPAIPQVEPPTIKQDVAADAQMLGVSVDPAGGMRQQNKNVKGANGIHSTVQVPATQQIPRTTPQSTTVAIAPLVGTVGKGPLMQSTPQPAKVGDAAVKKMGNIAGPYNTTSPQTVDVVTGVHITSSIKPSTDAPKVDIRNRGKRFRWNNSNSGQRRVTELRSSTVRTTYEPKNRNRHNSNRNRYHSDRNRHNSNRNRHNSDRNRQFSGESEGSHPAKEMVVDKLTGMIVGQQNSNNRRERSMVHDWLMGMEELPTLMIGMSLAERQHRPQTNPPSINNVNGNNQNNRNNHNQNSQRSFTRDPGSSAFDPFYIPSTNMPWLNQRQFTNSWW